MSRPEIAAGLDTSVLLRLLTGQPEALATISRECLARVEEAGSVVFVSNLVVSEAYFACQHHYGMPKAEVLAGLFTLLSQVTFVVQSPLLELLSDERMAAAKPGFLDRLIHAECAASGLTMWTFEKAASRLPGTCVLA